MLLNADYLIPDARKYSGPDRAVLDTITESEWINHVCWTRLIIYARAGAYFGNRTDGNKS